MILSPLSALSAAFLPLVAAAPQVTSSQGPQFENVTIYANSDRIQYYPTCTSKAFPECDGSWYKTYDARFSNGEAVMTGGISSKFANTDPYLVLNFKGSAMYMYQWVNASTAFQGRMYEHRPGGGLNTTAVFPPDPQDPGKLREEMVWKLEDLDPYKTHTAGLQVPYIESDGRKPIILDRIVITRIVGIDESAKSSNKSAKIGGAVAGCIIGLLAMAGLAFLYRRHKRAKAASSRRHAWEGTGGGISAKFDTDPSAEIMQSERIAREGADERKDPSKNSPPMPTLPHIS